MRHSDSKRARRNNGQEIVVRCDWLGPGAGRQSSGAAVSAWAVDPAPILAAASKEIGEANLRCVTFSGTGYSGPVGQTFENAPNIDWQRSEMANYTRTINWETGTSKETFDRKPGGNPGRMEAGIGWVDGTPVEGSAPDAHREWAIRLAHRRQRHTVAVPPELAEVYQLDIWLTHGF